MQNRRGNNSVLSFYNVHLTGTGKLKEMCNTIKDTKSELNNSSWFS